MPTRDTLSIKATGKKKIYWIFGMYGGERVRQSTFTTSRKEAEEYLVTFRQEKEDESKRAKNKQATFNKCAATHINMSTKKTLSKDAEYISALRPYIGDMDMGDICDRPQETDVGINYEELSPLNKFVADQSKRNICQKTINKKLSFLNTLAKKSIVNYQILGHREWINVRLVNKDERVFFNFKRSVRKTALEPEWRIALLNLLPEHLRDMAMFSMNTGQRDAIVCNLKWEWLREENGYYMFRIPREEFKSDEHIEFDEVFVMLNDIARDLVLKRKGNGSEHVFLDENGCLVPCQNADIYQTARVKVAEKYPDIMKTDVHSYKRTFVTALKDLDPKLDDATMQRLAQHVIRDTTERYVAWDQNMRGYLHSVVQRIVPKFTTAPKLTLHYDQNQAGFSHNKGAVNA